MTVVLARSISILRIAGGIRPNHESIHASAGRRGVDACERTREARGSIAACTEPSANFAYVSRRARLFDSHVVLSFRRACPTLAHNQNECTFNTAPARRELARVEQAIERDATYGESCC